MGISADLCKEIAERREKRLQSKITAWPRKNVIASDIPWCTRQGVYAITHWDKRKPHDTRLQARFDKGKQEEENALRELGELGFEVVEREIPLPKDMQDRYGITGRIDCKVLYRGKRIPTEVKSMHPMFFDKFDTLDDLKSDLFTSRYVRQLTIYLLATNEEEGMFLITDCLGHWKLIPCPLDYQEAEHCLQVAEEINAAVAAKTLPDRIPYDDEICGKCAFIQECLPDLEARARAGFEDDPEAEQDFQKRLERRETLQEGAKEYERLDKEIKDEFKQRYAERDIRILMVGDFTVSCKSQVRTFYEIPDEDKPKYATKKPILMTTIKRTSASRAEAA